MIDQTMTSYIGQGGLSTERHKDSLLPGEALALKAEYGYRNDLVSLTGDAGSREIPPKHLYLF